MKKITCLVCVLLMPLLNFPQKSPVKIAGDAQGTTYHITYFDEQNRDFKIEIEQILKDFDLSLSI